MTVTKIYQDIANQKPPVIYVSGKTSTGKSTFGRRLHDELNYQVIELEAVLLEIVSKHGFDEQTTFVKFYTIRENLKQRRYFSMLRIELFPMH